MNSTIRAPKWAYLMSGLLVVMSSVLGISIVYVAFVLLGILPRELDIQTPLLFVIFPLSILSLLTTVTMAILLTRKKE